MEHAKESGFSEREVNVATYLFLDEMRKLYSKENEIAT